MTCSHCGATDGTPAGDAGALWACFSCGYYSGRGA